MSSSAGEAPAASGAAAATGSADVLAESAAANSAAAASSTKKKKDDKRSRKKSGDKRNTWKEFLAAQGPDPKFVVLSAEPVPVQRGENAATSELAFIHGYAITRLTVKHLEIYCRHTKIPEYCNKSKEILCKKIVAWVKNKPLLDAGAASQSAPFKLNRFRLTNVLWAPEVLAIYHKWAQQPTADDLTVKKPALEDLGKAILKYYNKDPVHVGDDSDSDSDSDEEDEAEYSIDKINRIAHLLPGANAWEFDKLPSWQKAITGVKELHKNNRTLKADWKRSGDHRHVDEWLNGMKKDVLGDGNKKKPNTYSQNIGAVLYYFAHIKDHPELFQSVDAVMESGSTYDSAAPRKNVLSNPRSVSASASRKRKSDAGAAVAASMNNIAESFVTSPASKKRKTAFEINREMTLVNTQLKQVRDEYKEIYEDYTEKKAKKKNVSQTQDSLESTASSKREELKALKEQEKELKERRSKLAEQLRELD